MKIFTVGGAVRDSLLGLSVKDRDYVVVGATPEQMVALGYTPVGKDFPVFLHPQTHEEYALARTERKTAPGYRGFVFHADGAVTLEEDLVRRDLTINAMALSADGVLVDPFNGQADLNRRIFRHVSEAFAEDPVRILRVARFAARLTEFTVEPSTNALMQRMVAAGEVDALVPERVWQELARGLMEVQPSRMLDVLHRCGALARLLPELDRLWSQQDATDMAAMSPAAACVRSIDEAARRPATLPVRVAVLLCNLMPAASTVPHAVTADQRNKSAVDAIAARLKMPNDCRDLAVMTAREYRSVQHAADLSATDLVALIERCDGLRKPERFLAMLEALDIDRGVPSNSVKPQSSTTLLTRVLSATRAVDAGAIASHWQHSPAMIPPQVRTARIDAVSHAIATT